MVVCGNSYYASIFKSENKCPRYGCFRLTEWCLLFIRRKYELERIIMDLRRNIKEAITTGQMLEAVQLLTKSMIALVIIM